MKKNRPNAVVITDPATADVINASPGNGHTRSADSATVELSEILASLQKMKEGNFSVRLPGAWTGLHGKVADTFNDIVAANEQMALELARVGQAVGKKGRIRERAHFHAPKGAWGEMETSINTLVDDLLRPTTEVTRAIAAVAQGSLNEKVRLDVDGRPPGRRVPPFSKYR